MKTRKELIREALDTIYSFWGVDPMYHIDDEKIGEQARKDVIVLELLNILDKMVEPEIKKERYILYYSKYNIFANKMVRYAEIVYTRDIYHVIGELYAKSIAKVEKVSYFSIPDKNYPYYIKHLNNNWVNVSGSIYREKQDGE